MKRFVTSVATFILFAVAAPVYGAAFTFTGLQDTHWEHCVSMDSPRDNWGNNDPCDYPGKSANSDSVTIDDGNQSNVDLGTTLSDLSTVLIDAEANNATQTLNINSSGAFNTSGLFTVKAKTVPGPTRHALLNVVNTTANAFGPNSLKLQGNTSSLKGRAKLDVDGDVTVGVNGTEMLGHIDIDVLTGKTLDVDDVTINQTTTVLTLTGSGTFNGDTLVIDANADDEARSFEKAGDGKYTAAGQVLVKGRLTGTARNAKLIVSAGEFAATDEVELKGGDSVNSIAEVEVTGGTFTPKRIDAIGGNLEAERVVIDFDVDVTATATSSFTELSVEGIVDVELAAGKVYTARSVALFDGDTSLQVTGGNSATLARLVLDSFTNSSDGEIIYRNGLQVGFATP